MFQYKYGVQKQIGNEMVFFYMTEIEKDESFSHEFGTEKVIYLDLDGFLTYDDDYEDAESIETYFKLYHSELEMEIFTNYRLGLLTSKKVL